MLLLYACLQLLNLMIGPSTVVRYYHPLLLLLAIFDQQRLVPLADLLICSRTILANLSDLL